MDITLKVNKNAVYEEVAKTTSYIGDKMDDDKNAYNRIFTTDEDKTMLERFWDESKNMICNRIKKVLIAENDNDGEYSLSLGLSKAFDENLTESMQRSLFSFFVMSITAKWNSFSNKSEVTSYATEAASYIDDIMRKAFHKKKPTRPTYD